MYKLYIVYMSYYYNGIALSSLCTSINSTQSKFTNNLGITLNTSYTALSTGINEKPTKTGFYNAGTDISTYCIASYTENSISIPTWCTNLRVVLMGGGGNGAGSTTGQQIHTNAVQQAAVHTHQPLNQQAAVHTHQLLNQQAAVHTHQLLNQQAGYHNHVPEKLLTQDHIHQTYQNPDTAVSHQLYQSDVTNIIRDKNYGGGPTNIHNRNGDIDTRDFVYTTVVAVQQDTPTVQQTAVQQDTPAVQQTAVQQDKPAVQQAAVQQDTQAVQQAAVQQDKPAVQQAAVQSDIPIPGSGGGGGGFVYISTFQLANVTSPTISANSGAVSLQFNYASTPYSITANSGVSGQVSTNGAGGSVVSSNLTQTGEQVQGQTWLQGTVASGNAGTAATGGTSGISNLTALSTNSLSSYGLGGSSTAITPTSSYYRVYYLTS